MPLVIIKADEVRDGEPRWFAVSYADACRAIVDGEATPEFLHIDSPDSFEAGTKVTHAIVDRTEPPVIDPRREAFWSAAYCTAYSDGEVSEPQAGRCADASLAEWDRRWGGDK